MTVHSWEGKAVNIKQADTITIADTWATGDDIIVTIDGLDFTVTIGTLVTTAQVATTLKQAFNGETLTDTTASCTIPIADGGAQKIPQFKELVATVSSSVVTITSRTAGKPFTMTVAEDTAGDGTATEAAGTVNTGQHNADNADNFSGGAVLADNDTINFDDGSVDLKYALTLACQPLAINKLKSYTGNVGIPATNRDTSSYTYAEYRTPRYLTTDDNSVTTTANLETGEGTGSGRFMWDAGAGQALLNILGQGQRLETGVPCVLFKGTHASNEVNNLAGDLGVAFFPGETSAVPTLRTGDGPGSAAKTICGAGVTLTTTTCNGGTLDTNSAITTAHVNAGTHSHRSGTITTLNVNGGGTFYPLGDATITTLNVGSGGVFDTRKGVDTFVITNTIQLYKGASFIDEAGRAGNVVFKLNQCALEDVTIKLAKNKTFTLS